jgi:alpha-tubulin suppressor-like RCC1 family protein
MFVASGQLFALGNNSHGKLGLNDFPVNRFCEKPQKVQSLNQIQKVACGHFHTVCITVGGQAFAWGQHLYGALGMGVCKNDA